MSVVNSNQPYGTPTWLDLGVPDLEQAQEFYGAVFGWEYEEPSAASGPYVLCLLRGERVAGLRPVSGADVVGESWWTMYLATDDCDAAARRVAEAGGRVLQAPSEIGELGRAAVAEDRVGARFGLWQGRTLPGCARVNEPDTLVRNDLAAPDPEPARSFYATVFGFTLDTNQDLPGADFTFLRRPDGHEIGGVFGAPDAPAARWRTTFEVADTDAALGRAVTAGGTVGPPSDTLYGRMAEITDPCGTPFAIIARPAAAARR